MPLHRHRPETREVRRSFPDRVDEDPGEGECLFEVAQPLVIAIDGVLHRRFHRVFGVEEADAEWRALEPAGDRLSGFHLGEDEAIFVVNVHGGDEFRRRRRNFPEPGGVVEEGVGVGEEGAMAAGKGGDDGLERWVIQRRPCGGAYIPPKRLRRGKRM